MSILKEEYINMKRSNNYPWALFFEYWEDKGGNGVSFADFSDAIAKAWPALGLNGDVLVNRMIEYFDAKLAVIKIISPQGQLLKEY